jgi:hypothetical protein
MLDNSKTPDKTLNEILETLSVKEDPFDTIYETQSREDYDRLLDAALNGNLDGHVSVGHSAIYRNKLRITPPSELAN